MSDDLHDEIIVCLPRLHAFAFHLSHDRELADEMVQEAVTRALSHAHCFERGTNFQAWASAILRNCYYDEMRHRGHIHRLKSAACGEEARSGGQEEALDLNELARAYESLPARQREAIVLVAARGLSYQRAAGMAGCTVGTIKSRVARARMQLQHMLDGDSRN